jgi:hypothetical protein
MMVIAEYETKGEGEEKRGRESAKDNERGEKSERAKRRRRRENNFGYMVVDVKERKREDEKGRKKQLVVVDLLDLF